MAPGGSQWRRWKKRRRGAYIAGVLRAPRRPPPAAVLFDLDGTLVDSLPDLAAAMNATLAELGQASHPVAFYRPLIGGGVEEMIAGALPPARRGARSVAAARTLMRAHYRAHALRTTRPYPGVRWLLAALARRRVPMAVLSNKLHEETLQVVGGIFPGVPFQVVLGLQPPRAAKPDPAGVVAAARRLGLPPRRLLLVGDGETDMLAARRCGARPLGATWGYRGARALLAAGAARLAPHPRAVYGYLLRRGSAP